MTDHEFVLAILDLMPQDNVWVSFISGLQDKLHDTDSQRAPFCSVVLISCIRDEYWCQHKDNNKNQSSVFTAQFDALNKSSSNKRGRTDEIIATMSTSTKRQHTLDLDRPRTRCANPHCVRKSRHDMADCIAYTGTKQGQYPD